MSKYKALEEALAYAKQTGGIGLTASVADLDALLADLERAEKDAERYRWLRGHVGEITTSAFGEMLFYGSCNDPDDAERLDAAIDAALAQMAGG